MKTVLVLILSVVFTVLFTGCAKDDIYNPGSSRLTIRLTDAPATYDRINIEIVGLEVKVNDSTIIMDVETGIYNLLDLVNGKDTVIADQQIPSGKLSQIRLILGENNTLVTGQSTFDLKTPSAQQSGLKLNVHEDFTAGIAYEYTVDFDAAKSIVETGSGKYILKPVLRVSTSAVSGAIKGIVYPAQAKPTIYAISSQLDSTSTYADTTTGSFMFSGLTSGTYNLSFQPLEPYADTILQNISVTNGIVTRLDTLKFR